jgi:hypothetical protein
MTRHRRSTKPRSSPYYPSQQHAGPAGYGDSRARFGPVR